MSNETKDVTSTIDRREAVRRVSLMLGGLALVGGDAFVTGFRRAPAPEELTGQGLFSAADVSWLDEVADTILPTTSTPGAKAAKVGAFMVVMVTDSYQPPQQQAFREGMTTLEAECVKTTGAGYLAASPAQRLALLERIDRECKAYMDSKDRPAKPHYFRMIKELTLLGYFTSEIGMTQAQRYVETPGRFDPCVPYAKGEKAWAGHA
jgi:hypothetical protein